MTSPTETPETTSTTETTEATDALETPATGEPTDDAITPVPRWRAWIKPTIAAINAWRLRTFTRPRMWRWVGQHAFRLSPHMCYGFRRRLLRRFGTTIAGSAKVRRTVEIDRPWNVSIGDLTVVGDAARFRAAEPITIGSRCVISQYAILLTEMRAPDIDMHPMQTAPITIEDDAWVATDVFLEPGTRVESGAVIGARANASGTVPAWQISVGRPARPRGPRTMTEAIGTSHTAGSPDSSAPTAESTAA